MANALFANFKNLMLGGGTHTLPNLSSATIEVSLIDAADVTVNVATHQDEADITAGIVANVALGSKTIGTVAAGVFDAADSTFTSVTGDQSENLVIHKGAGTASSDPLIAFFDTFTSGMPVTPNGGNITVTWNASGIIVL